MSKERITKVNCLSKVLSMLLMITMLLELIPMGFWRYSANATELPGETITYNFRRYGYADNTSINGRDVSYAEYTELRPWAYVSDTFTSSGGSAGTPVALLTNYKYKIQS